MKYKKVLKPKKTLRDDLGDWEVVEEKETLISSKSLSIPTVKTRYLTPKATELSYDQFTTIQFI